MQQAGTVLDEISKKTELPTLTFLKENYDFETIRKRQFQPNFTQLIGVMITKLSILAGIKNEIDFANKSDLLRFVKTRCSALTLEEFYKAFELERFGLYETKTEHYGLFNAEYCAAIINKYLKWKKNSLIDHNITRNINNVPPEVTPSAQKEVMNNALVRVFNEFKETKQIPRPNNYIFDELVEREIILLGVTDKLVAYYEKTTRIARSQLLRELEATKKSALDKAENRSIKEQIEKIQKGGSNSVYARVKEIVLTEFFQKLILQEKDIQEIILENDETRQNIPSSGNNPT
jgi:hypothetical protein